MLSCGPAFGFEWERCAYKAQGVIKKRESSFKFSYMKRVITICILLATLHTQAQVFTGGGGPVQNNGQDTYFPVSVSGLTSIDSVYGLEQVCFNINHPDVSELYVYLQSPSGTLVNLTLGSSSSGANFLNTCVNSQNVSSITLGSAPYSGTYKPVGYLGRFNTGQAGNGVWNLIVHDGFPGNPNAGTLVSWSLQFGSSPSHPVPFQSSDLPLVFINTTQSISDTKILVGMSIVDNGAARNHVNDPPNGYNAKAEIHWHGSSTKNFEKKSFAIETRDVNGNKINASLLGMPAENDWILMASYIDKTLIRNSFTNDLYTDMGHYAARHRNVELVINGEYQGVYILTEKLKRDSNRIHTQTISPMANGWPAISGGYVFKIDRTDASGWYSLLPGNSQAGTHFYYNYVYPSDADITVPQQNYIKSYVDSFETVMNAANYADPVTGYRKFIDVSTFIDFFIVNELAKNVDGYRLSTYMYKKNITKGGKMYIGPVWDYDIAWHDCNYGNTNSPSGWQYTLQNDDYPSPTWWGRFMQDTAFVNALICRWAELRQNVLSLTTLYNYIDSSANVFSAESQQRNFTQFPVIGAYIYPNPQIQSGATYQTEINDLKTWVANRVAWMDGALAGTCTMPVAEMQNGSSLSVFPNPFGSATTFLLQLPVQAPVAIQVTNVVGQAVWDFYRPEVAAGELKVPFERNSLAPGVYFYRVSVGKNTKSGKLIIE